MTPMPVECRAPAPAPVEIASGSTPRMNAIEVIRIGRKRSRDASIAAAAIAYVSVAGAISLHAARDATTPPTSLANALPPDAAGGYTFKNNCAACHGPDGKGSPQGPDLTSGHWIRGDGSLAAIEHTINVGVPRPQKYGAPMPPMGGAQLSSSELSAVAAYVWALGHRSGG